MCSMHVESVRIHQSVAEGRAKRDPRKKAKKNNWIWKIHLINKIMEKGWADKADDLAEKHQFRKPNPTDNTSQSWIRKDSAIGSPGLNPNAINLSRAFSDGLFVIGKGVKFASQSSLPFSSWIAFAFVAFNQVIQESCSHAFQNSVIATIVQQP